MTVEEAKERLTALVEIRGRKYSDGERSSIEELYSLVLDKPFVRTQCNDCYHDGAIEALLYIKRYNKFADYKSMEYILKSGALVRFSVTGPVYSNDNLTSEIAEKYLEQNEKRINWFAKFPEDWKERVAKRRNRVEIALKEDQPEAKKNRGRKKNVTE